MVIVDEFSAGVTGGVDTHLDTHVAAALDPVGGLLGVEVFARRHRRDDRSRKPSVRRDGQATVDGQPAAVHCDCEITRENRVVGELVLDDVPKFIVAFIDG